MAFNFDLNTIDSKTKYLIFGYIRRSQQLLPNDNPYFNIPNLVTYACIHYYDIAKYISFDTKSSTAKISGNKNNVITWESNDNFAWKTGYGSLCMSATKNKNYTYKVKLNGDMSIVIGISEFENEELWYKKNCISYVYLMAAGEIYANGSSVGEKGQPKNDGEFTMELIVDFESLRLTFKMDNKLLHVQKIEKKQYKLVVNLGSGTAKATILE